MRALGLAVHYLMRQPSFANMLFGHWARTLVGQINRRHYAFVVQGKDVVGFIGWAMTSQEAAEAWLGGTEIDSRAATGGDCMIVNAWQANSNEVNSFLFSQLRQAAKKPRLVYGKRYYSNGRWRPVRFEVK